MLKKVVIKFDDNMYGYLKKKSEEKHASIEDYIKGCIATVGCMDMLSELAKLEKDLSDLNKK